MAKKVIKEYSSEMKFAKNIYASDVIFIVTFFIASALLGGIFVAESLRTPFYIVSGIYSILLVRKSRQNPRIRNYRAIVNMIREKKEKSVFAQAFLDDLCGEEKEKK